MTAAPLGWEELFDPSKVDTDSLVPFLGVAQLLATEARVVVDVGCGRGAQVDSDDAARTARPLQDLRGTGRTVIGIDIDPAAADNPIVDEFRLIGDDLRWPLTDASVDLAVSDFTLEHVEDPVAFVAELTRVLRPGGAFVARTVSRYSLLSVTARAVPNARHAGVLSHLQPTRQARDVFPTAYRMNARTELAALFDRDYDWALAHRGGLEQYLKRWPWLRRVAGAGEPRLPRALQTALVVYARKRERAVSQARSAAEVSRQAQ